MVDTRDPTLTTPYSYGALEVISSSRNGVVGSTGCDATGTFPAGSNGAEASWSVYLYPFASATKDGWIIYLSIIIGRVLMAKRYCLLMTILLLF